MKWLLYFSLGLIILTSDLYGQAESISIFEIDSSSFPTMKAKFYAFNAKKDQVSPNMGELKLTENGIVRTITNVYCPPSPPPSPLSSVLTMDVSGSMIETYNNIPRIELAKIAARTWVNTLDFSLNECALTSFDENNYLNQDYTNDPTSLLSAINKLTPQGGTDYDKGLLSKPAGSLEITKRGKFKRVVVFLTDGYPNRDPQVFDIINEAKQQNCIIYAVMIGLNCPQSLRFICSQTGGLWFENINSVGEALEVYNVILKRSQGIETCSITWESAASCASETRNVSLIWNNGPSSSGSYITPNVTGNGLTVNPKAMYMNIKPNGVQFDTTVIITAQKATVTVYDITSTNIEYDIFPKKFTLAPGRSIQLTVRYTPSSSSYTWTRFDFLTDVCPAVLYVSAGQKGKISPQDAIKLTKPNGNEVFVVGSDTLITWKGVPKTDIVRLEYSTDNGGSWINITDNATGGSFAWKKIPNTPSNQCLVRITQLGGGVAESKSFALSGHNERVFFAKWSPDGSRVATASADSTMRIWDASSGMEIQRYTSHKGSVNDVEWSKDGKRIITASSDSTARIWDIANGTELVKFKGHAGSVECASISPDRTRVATASLDNSVRIWDANSGKELMRFPGHTNSISIVRWNPDAVRIASSRSDTRIFDASSGTDLVLQNGHNNLVDNIAWSPNGIQLATASRDSTARIWDAFTGITTVILSGHKGAVKQLSWSPDGSKIATASADNTAQIWDAVTGILLKKLEGHTGEVSYVSWSPDGKGIATASTDNTARIWDISTGKEIQRLKGHADKVYNAVWSPDGSRLATSSLDYTAWIWDVSSAFAKLSDVSDAVFSIVVPIPSSANIDMNQVLVGNSKDSLVQSFVKNTGSFSFKVKEIHIVGKDSANFSLISGFPPFDVPPLSSYAVEFRFLPTSIGIKTADVIIITQNDTLRQTIKGEGVASQITIVNNVIDFGLVEVKAVKDTLQAVTIKNIGNAPITILNTRHSTPNDIDFSTISGGGSFTLSAGESSKMDLRFIPNSEGRTNGRLLFEYAGVGSPATIQLYGEGVAPLLEVVNDTIDFGTVGVGSSKDSIQVFTVKNSGKLPLTIKNIRFFNPTTNEFAILSGGGTFIIPPQESAKMDLRFSPNSVGFITEQLLFDYNGTNTPAKITLLGEGIIKDVISTQIINNNIDFGKVVIGLFKDSIKAVTIRNNGNVAITITSLQFVTPTETAFSVLADPTPLVLNPKDTIRLDLRFTPSKVGNFNNSLRFNYNGAPTTPEIELLGEGVNSTPSVQLLTPEIDFGKVELGTYKDTLQAIALKNNGIVGVTVSNIQNALPSELDFTIVNNSTPYVLNPNDTFKLDIRFTPSVSTIKTGKFRFNFLGSVPSLDMSIKGEGIETIKPTATALFEVGSAEAEAGEIVKIPIKLSNSKNITQSGINKFHARIKFNSTLLEPVGATPRGILQGNDRLIELDLPIQTDVNNNLILLTFRAGLGNDSTTLIILDSVEAIGGNLTMTSQNGKFRLLGICQAGGARLLNPNGIISLSLIRPNPPKDYAEVEIETTEIGNTTLELYSTQGKKIRTFIDGIIEPAHRILQLDLQGLNSGTYILILQTPTEKRNTIFEVIH